MRKRLLLSILTIFSILAISFVIILWAQGNRIDFKNDAIEITGVLDIKSTPSNALVEINGKQKGYTPLSIDALYPGKYTIKVSKNTLTSWEGVVYIDPGKITNIYPILLNLNSPSTKINSQGPVIDSVFSPYQNAIVYEVSSNGESSLWSNIYNNSIFSSGNSETDILDITNGPLNGYKIDLSKSIFSPDNQRILLYATDKNNRSTYFILQTNSINTTPVDLNTIIDTSLYKSVYWSTDSTHLILQSNGILVSVDLSSSQKYILLQNNSNTLTTFAQISNTLYIPTQLQNHTYLLEEQIDGSNQRNIDLNINDPINSIISNQSDMLSFSTDKNTYIYTISTGEMNKIFNNYSQLISFSPNGNDILFLSNHNYLVYIKTGDISTSLNLSDITVKAIYWHPFSSEIIYLSANADGSYDINAEVPTGEKSEVIYKNISSPYIVLTSQGTSVEALIKDSIYSINIAPNSNFLF